MVYYLKRLNIQLIMYTLNKCLIKKTWYYAKFATRICILYYEKKKEKRKNITSIAFHWSLYTRKFNPLEKYRRFIHSKKENIMGFVSFWKEFPDWKTSLLGYVDTDRLCHCYHYRLIVFLWIISLFPNHCFVCYVQHYQDSFLPFSNLEAIVFLAPIYILYPQ